MARYALTRHETAQIAEIADRFLTGRPAWDPLCLADEIRGESERLPEGLRRFLAASRAAEKAVISVVNLPLDADLVPTPADWRVAEKERAAVREELVLLLVASVLGDPFAWSDQQNGRLVHDVCPAKGSESSLTSASSELQLALHTEDVFHACRGDYVALMCLRNPDGVGTTVAALDSAALPESIREILHQDRFRFYTDDSHMRPPDFGEPRPVTLEERKHEVASVLFGPRESPYLRIDADFTAPLPGDAEAARAMRECVRVLNASAEHLVLVPGQVAFLDNYRVVHGREFFTPRYDGTDRWLKRTSVARDLRRAYVHTRSRSRVLS